MRFLKAALIFLASFVVAWIIIFTFIQEPFHHPAPAKVLWYESPPFPIYYYVVGTFLVGLLIGIIMSAYYYITLSVTIAKKDRELRALAGRVGQIEKALERSGSAAAEKPTARLAATTSAVEPGEPGPVEEDDDVLADDDDDFDPDSPRRKSGR
jgi:uncharacterized membrane protein YciS (DUF1049 family)